MADGEQFVGEVDLYTRECMCGQHVFQLTSGVHLYRLEDNKLNDDVRWFYVGCRCLACSLVGCYADWKSEHSGYKALLANV